LVGNASLIRASAASSRPVEYERGWDAKLGKGAEYKALHTLRTVKNERGNNTARPKR
jgi:hypothetical protein